MAEELGDEGGYDPGVEPGVGDAPPDDAGLEDMRPEPHDKEDDRL